MVLPPSKGDVAAVEPRGFSYFPACEGSRLVARDRRLGFRTAMNEPFALPDFENRNATTCKRVGTVRGAGIVLRREIIGRENLALRVTVVDTIARHFALPEPREQF
jgi:hypothetical protein